MAQPIRFHDLFSAKLSQAQLANIPPVPSTANVLAWQRRYRILTTGIRSMGIGGHLVLTRRPTAGGRFELTLDYRKRAVPGFENVLAAKIICAADQLGTPQSWRFESTTHNVDDDTVAASTRWVQQGVRSAGGYTLKEGKDERPLPVSGPVTVNWTLLAILGALPKEAGPPIPLTLLDDFDHVKPGMELRGRGTREVLVGGKNVVHEREIKLERGRVFRPERTWQGGQPMQITRHDLTGPGLVPRAHYTDQAGRMLFMTAGTEGLVLEADGPIPAPEEK